MEARATLRPGQRGTKKLVARFGDRLICVRYRYDTTHRKRFTTVELIVDESDWTASIPIASEEAPPLPSEDPTETRVQTPAEATKQPHAEPPTAKSDLVGLRVGFKEMNLRQKVKAVGAKWDPGRRLWMLRRDRAIGLGLQERIATPAGEQKIYAMRYLLLTPDTSIQMGIRETCFECKMPEAYFVYRRRKRPSTLC